MLRDRIKKVMSQTFTVPVEEIQDEATMEHFAKWTSLGHLELMLAIEMEFGVSIPTHLMVDLVSMEALEEFLGEKVTREAA